MSVIHIPILNKILIIGGENDGTNMSKLGSVSSASSSSSNLSDQGKYEKQIIKEEMGNRIKKEEEEKKKDEKEQERKNCSYWIK